MAIHNLGATMHAACDTPTCWADYPHCHQHFILWPDEDPVDQ